MAMRRALAVIVLAACGQGTRPEAAPPPVPAPAPAAEAPVPVRHSTDILVCLLQDGELRIVPVQYDRRTGDTTVNGRPFSEVYGDTAGYASAADWYALNEPITVNGRRHVKYGIPRILGPHEITRAGEYRGVPLFVEAGHPPTSEIKYVPVRPGCEFQPYDGHANVGAVRG